MAKKSFPDLTGDGKVTQKDILKARGVKLKKGGMVKGFKHGGAVTVKTNQKPHMS